MKNRQVKKWTIALLLLLISTLLPVFAQSFSTKEKTIEYGLGENVKAKIPYITSSDEGILKEKSRVPRKVVIKPAQSVTVENSKSYDGQPPNEITEFVDGKLITLKLKETKECTEGTEIDFDDMLENVVRDYYKDGKVVKTAFSLGDSSNNQSVELVNHNGMTGTVRKVDGSAKLVTRYDEEATGYDKVVVSVWQAKFQGKVKINKTGYIGIYEGTYMTSDICGEAFTVTYFGRVEDTNFIHTKIGAATDHVGDPVAVNTGNFIYSKMSVRMDNLGFPLMFINTYNSRDHEEGILGLGWSTNWDISVKKDGDAYNFKDFDGRRYNLILNKGKYSTREGANIDLEVKNNKKYVQYNQIQYIFDEQDKLVQILDDKNNSLDISYKNGKISEIKSKDNKTLSFAYSGTQLTEVLSSTGESVKFEFSQGQVSKITKPDNSVSEFKYSNDHLVKVIEDGVTAITNTYDEIGRVEKQVDDAGITYTFDRADDNGTVTFTDSSVGEPIVYKVNEAYQVTEVVYKDGTKETCKYDQNGNKIEISTRDGSVVKQVYDSQNNLKESYVEGHENSKSEYTYDNKNRLEKVVRAGRLLETYEYNASNLLIKYTSYLDESKTAVYEYKYDAFGRKIEEINPLKASTKYEYLNMETSPKKITYPEGNFVEYEYDINGQIIKVKDASGTSEMKYDGSGNVIESIDKEGNSTIMKYDGRNRLIETIMPEQSGTAASYKYEYDEKGNIVKTIDPLGNTTKAVYSNQGELIKTILPEEYNNAQDGGKGVEMVYDKYGRVVKQISPTGQVSAYEYDKTTGQLVGIKTHISMKKNPNANARQFEYDDFGRLVVEKDSQNKVLTKNIYDEFGQLVKVIDANGYASGSTDDKRYGTLYKYNYQGWLLESRTPKKIEGEEVRYQVKQYEYDLQGRITVERTGLDYVTQSTLPTQWTAMSNTYDKNGQLTTVTDSSGSELKNKYDGIGRLIEKSEKVTANSYRITQFEYSPNGNLLKEKVQSWQGDLVTENAEAIITAYAYDKNGNCISVTSPEGHVTSYVYNANNQLVKEEKKYTQLSYSQVFSKAMLSAPLNQVMPGQNISIDLTAKPAELTSANSFTIEYDANALTYLEQGVLEGTDSNLTVEVEELSENKLVVRTNGVIQNKQNPIARLIFAATDQSTGKTQVKIAAESTMTNDSGTKAYDLLEGVCVSLKGPDLNRDGQVKADDLSIIGKNSGKTNLVTRIEKMSDLNSDGTITDDDLDIFKNWLFDETEKNLKKLDNPTGNANGIKISPSETATKKDYSIEYEYDRNGNVTMTKDSEGNQNSYVYNASGDLIKEKSSTGEVKYYEYLVDGVLDKSISNAGTKTEVTQYDYNINGQTTSIKNGADQVLEEFEYNASGQLISRKSNKTTTHYDFDIGGRLIETREASGQQIRTTQMTYDVRDLMLTQTDAKNQTTTYKYDNWGNLIETTDALGNKTTMTYDLLGRQTSLKDPKNQIFEYSYTADGKTKAVKYPDGKSIRYAYDKEGNTVEKVNKDGSKVVYTYNELGQCVKEVSGTDEVHYALTPDNRLLSAWNSNALIENTFDSNNQLSEVRQNGEVIAQYTYDGFGRRQSETDKTGLKRSYQYDGDYVSGISIEGKASVNFTRNYFGQLTATQYSDGLNLNIEYGDFGAVQSMKWAQNGSPIDNFQYQYDPLGNITEEQSQKSTITYGYDPLSRLTSAKSDKNFEETYQYDAAGNRTEKVTNGIKTTYKYGSNNQLLESTTGKDTTKFAYDTNGRLQTETSKSNTRQYTYDGFNRQKQVTDKNGSFENLYSPLGERMAIIENGTTTTYTYGTSGMLTEEVDNSLERSYIGNNSGILMQIDSEGKVYDQVINRRGDVNYLVTKGKIANQYEYSPYGELLSSTESITNHMKYSGEQQDSFTGNYYLNTRFYSPELGRFTQEDSYLGDGNNLYAYVQNNPMNYVDPSGMKGCPLDPINIYVNNTNKTFSLEGQYTLLEGDNGNVFPARLERYGKNLAAMPINMDVSSQLYFSYESVISGHTTLDLLGCADPTGIVDLLNGSWYAAEGDVKNAAISYASIFPLGDAAKLGHVKAYLTAIKFTKTKAMAGVGKKAFQFVCKNESDVIQAANKVNKKVAQFAKGAGNSIAKFTRDEAREAVQGALRNGEIGLDVLKSMIPDGVKNTFVATDRIKDGKKYIFELADGQKATIRWHAPDPEAAIKYPGSASGSRWTAQIQIGNKSLGADGKWYKNQSIDIVHIPIKGK